MAEMSSTASASTPMRSEASCDMRGFTPSFLYRKHAPPMAYGSEKFTSSRRASVIVMVAMLRSAVPALSRGSSFR